MHKRPIAAIILAAGKGTRMKSKKAKVLHPIGGRPMVIYTVRVAMEFGADPVVVVVGHQAGEVKEAITRNLGNQGISFALQKEQLGTGHAVLSAKQHLRGFSGDVLILSGDVPLLTKEIILSLHRRHIQTKALVSVLSTQLPNPYGYGRCVVDSSGKLLRIVEEHDGSKSEKEIHEVNTGIYIVDKEFLFKALTQVGTDNNQGEIYLTDIVRVASARDLPVYAFCTDMWQEVMGINSRAEQARAHDVMRRKILNRLMETGVTILDPAVTYVEDSVTIGADTVLHPQVHLLGKTVIGRDCEIMTGTHITDSELANDIRIFPYSVLEGAKLESGTQIGPFARLRPGAVVCKGARIGNFVELKKAEVGENTKVMHLTYLGDAHVGKNVNVGAGTITCNYDGVHKHTTTIEDGVFIGSDSQFVAPVLIGKNSFIGAGSTITQDVPPEALAVSRGRQLVKENWVKSKRKS